MQNGKGDKNRTKNIKAYKENHELLWPNKEETREKDFLNEMIDTLPKELAKEKGLLEEPDAED